MKTTTFSKRYAGMGLVLAAFVFTAWKTAGPAPAGTASIAQSNRDTSLPGKKIIHPKEIRSYPK